MTLVIGSLQSVLPLLASISLRSHILQLLVAFSQVLEVLVICSFVLWILWAYDPFGLLPYDPRHNCEISPSQRWWLTFPFLCLSIEFLDPTVSCPQMQLESLFREELHQYLLWMRRPVIRLVPSDQNTWVLYFSWSLPWLFQMPFVVEMTR